MPDAEDRPTLFEQLTGCGVQDRLRALAHPSAYGFSAVTVAYEPEPRSSANADGYGMGC